MVPASASASASDKPTDMQTRSVTMDEIETFMKNPGSLVGKTFVLTVPENDDDGTGLWDDEQSGPWTVNSYEVRVEDGRPLSEFLVSVPSLEGDELPMGEREVKEYLKHSEAVGL